MVNVGFDVTTPDYDLLGISSINVQWALDGGAATNLTGWPVSDPFSTGIVCSSGLDAVTTSCDVTDTHNASMALGFVANAEGQYTVWVSAVHGNATDTEDVSFTVSEPIVVTVVKAPPAIANEYLNSGIVPKKTLTTSVRGCIISQIAENHAHDSKYGPKGGPYNVSEIQADALSYYSTCQPQ